MGGFFTCILSAKPRVVQYLSDFASFKSIKMKSLGKLFVFMLVFPAVNTALAQNSASDDQARKTAEVQQFVNNANYIFEATVEYPQKGTEITLNSEYHLKVSKDSIIASLPFDKNSSASSANSIAAGINFTWTNFYYTTTKGKNGSWDVIIKPKTSPGTGDIRQLSLLIETSGHTMLKVISIKTPVSYYGYLKNGTLQLNADVRISNK